MFCPRCFATFCARRLVNWGQNGGEAHETQRTDRIVGAVGGTVPVHGAGAAAGQPVAARAGAFVPGAFAGGSRARRVGGVVDAVSPQPLPPEQLLQPVQRQSLAALCGT